MPNKKCLFLSSIKFCEREIEIERDRERAKEKRARNHRKASAALKSIGFFFLKIIIEQAAQLDEFELSNGKHRKKMNLKKKPSDDSTEK